jgi:hypothetical protein
MTFGPWSDGSRRPLIALIILYSAALAFALVGLVMAG